jgi:hypothetical protein
MYVYAPALEAATPTVFMVWLRACWACASSGLSLSVSRNLECLGNTLGAYFLADITTCDLPIRKRVCRRREKNVYFKSGEYNSVVDSLP